MTNSSCRVYINWEHFRHNVKVLMKKGHEIMPVIKADAYGHGVERACRELENMGVGWIAAGTPEEAALIRDCGFSGYIISLLCSAPNEEDMRLASEKHIILLIHNHEGLLAVKNALAYTDTIDIAVKADTGMSRLGFRLSEMESIAAFLAKNTNIRPIVLLSHFSAGDEPDEDDYTAMQCSIFYQAAAIMHRYFPSMRCSLGNTSALIRHMTHKDDICRPGLAIYGYNPLCGTSEEDACDNLLPVMEVSAPLMSVHALHKGETLGYGRAYKAESERIVGWVAIGYADGYRRNPAPETCMCINGTRVPVIGRVAMQMTCVDLSDLPYTPAIGDTVYILGGPGHAVSAQDIASWWGTIPYEVTCLLGKNKKVHDTPAH